MDLCLHSFNKQQGSTGDVVFITSQLLQQQLDLAPDSVISGRPLARCRTLVKCVNLNRNHWTCAVWSRQRPTSVYTLDSMQGFASPQQALVHFVALCQSLTGDDGDALTVKAVPVAQHSDVTSCGLFVIEFCRVLCAEGADITSEATRSQLHHVDTTRTRTWLGTFSRTTDVTLRDPLFIRSSASKRNRTKWDAEQAAASTAIE